jgi:hypothetical protein
MHSVFWFRLVSYAFDKVPSVLSFSVGSCLYTGIARLSHAWAGLREFAPRCSLVGLNHAADTLLS